MVIESIWYYIFIFKEHKKYKWSTPSQIDLFFRENRFIGSYKFNNLQEVFGLVIYFFNLESFCTDKFKQFFLPVLMQNSQLSKEIPLMFKIPKTGDDEDLVAQSILVTRKCSFDMAFYQVTHRLARLIAELPQEKSAPHWTQEQLAARLGTVREVVARSMKELERSGAIKVEDRRIQIVDQEIFSQWLQ